MKPVTFSGVSVVMPTYNEAGHIQDLIRATLEVLAKAGIDKHEIIVVDDDSPDRTWERAQQTPGADGSRLSVVRRTEGGIDGLAARGNPCGKIRCHRVDGLRLFPSTGEDPSALFMLDEGYDVVVNSRYAIGGGEDRGGKGGALQLVLSRVLNWGIRFMLKPAFSDFTSGFVATRRAVLDEYELTGDYGSISSTSFSGCCRGGNSASASSPTWRRRAGAANRRPARRWRNT